MSSSYSATALTPAEVQALPGMTLIEFGTDWCGHCQAAQPLLDKVLVDYPEVQHLKICLLYTSPSPRDLSTSRMPSSA